jgi:hypothetical protein
MKNDSMATLEKRLSKWEKIVNGLKITLGFYAFLVLTFLAIQGIVAQQQMAAVLEKVEDTTQAVRDSQIANQKTGTDNHEKTRAYIKCLVSEVLTVPLSERNNIDLDSCTRKIDEEQKAQSNTSQTTPKSMVIPQPNVAPTPIQPTTPKPSEPAAAAPPDPEPVEDRSALGKLPLVGGLLDAIGL